MHWVDKESMFLWYKAVLYMANFFKINLIPHEIEKFMYGLKFYWSSILLRPMRTQLTACAGWVRKLLDALTYSVMIDVVGETIRNI